MRYAVLATLGMCVLQRFHISQFFELLNFKQYFDLNLVTGFLGNGTHLSGFLGMCVPLFLWRFNREDKLALILLFLVLYNSGMMLNDPAISGFVVSGFILVYWNKTSWWKVGLLGLVGLGILFGAYRYYPQFLNMAGRDEIWKIYLPKVKPFALTGAGLGYVAGVYKSTPMPETKHLHFEYLQILVESGIIGLVLVINIIKVFFEKHAQGRTELTLKAMFLGFLISCCFAYPAHLWLPATWACFSYSAFTALKGNRKWYQQEKKLETMF